MCLIYGLNKGSFIRIFIIIINKNGKIDLQNVKTR